jgi:hypothetical protein
MENYKINSVEEHAVKCPICYEVFSDIYKPLIIPCGHTICSRCVEELKKLAKEDYDNSYHSNDEEDISVSLSEDSDSESIEDNEENEEESEHEESQESEESEESEHTDSDNQVIHIVEEKIPSNIKESEEKSFKIQCSICRHKMRITNKDIIINNTILSFINMMEHKEKKEPVEHKRIFCKYCKIIENEDEHISKYQHGRHIIALDNNEFQNLKTINNDFSEYTETSHQVIEKAISEIYNSSEMEKANDYIIQNFKSYSRAIYVKNKSFRNFTKLYSKFENMVKAERIEDAEKCYNKSIELVEKYYHKINTFIYYLEGVINRFGMNKNNIINLTKKFIKNGLFESYLNNSLISEKRYVSSVDPNQNSVFIYDLRLLSAIYIPYNKIFENLGEEHLSPYYSNFTEIDNEGRYLYILGENGEKSDKFKMYDLLNRQLIMKKDIPSKYKTFNSIVYGSRIFILGGIRDEDDINTLCYYYDNEVDFWFELPDLKIKRRGQSVCVHNNVFYLYGGTFFDEESQWRSSFEYLDLDNPYEWRIFQVKDFAMNLVHPYIGFVSNDKMIILAGEEQNSYEESETGYVIDIKDKILLEEFKINRGYFCFSLCANYRNILVGSFTDNGGFARIDLKDNFSKLKTII